MKKIDEWKFEEKYGMKGWDFSHLDGRWENETLPWNYVKLVLKYLRDDMKLLDMGTGGGELLRNFHHPFQNTIVTEAWKPNIEFLYKNLSDTGIVIIESENESDLPVNDESLDIITNSHAAFDIDLINKKLKKNGLFITQQVGALNNYSLSKYFDSDYSIAYPENTLLNTLIDCENSGFEIIYYDEYKPTMKFFDVGAIVYYASVIPWEFPNFSVENDLKKLNDLDKLINKFGYVSTNEDRFMLIVRKK
ncbi:methyltransferase domain-containing protein [Fructilactobacillus sp. Tb1]|uniref:methyltransferase domain-containing protein n=1 Tax=Fructilactobacillus sp. Tb1 TaxID=3422304 RepID=UPI003D2E8DB0